MSASAEQLGGGTIRLTIGWVNWAQDQEDPDPGTQTLTIYDSHGDELKSLTESDLTRDGIGEFHYDYVTPTVTVNDEFLALWFAQISTTPDLVEYFFTVKAR
jgi:hypothetical protein